MYFIVLTTVHLPSISDRPEVVNFTLTHGMKSVSELYEGVPFEISCRIYGFPHVGMHLELSGLERLDEKDYDSQSRTQPWYSIETTVYVRHARTGMTGTFSCRYVHCVPSVHNIMG